VRFEFVCHAFSSVEFSGKSLPAVRTGLFEFCAINYCAALTFPRLFTSGAPFREFRPFSCVHVLDGLGDAFIPLLACIAPRKLFAPFGKQTPPRV
jgi:hypothetical protein